MNGDLGRNRGPAARVGLLADELARLMAEHETYPAAPLA